MLSFLYCNALPNPSPEFPSPFQGQALCYLKVPGSLNSLKIGSPKSWSGLREAANSPAPGRASLQATVSWKYTVFLFALLGEAFLQPFTVISSLTQHPCGAYPPFRESPWRLSAVEGQLGQRLTPSPLLRLLRRYIYGKIVLQIETESLFLLDLSLNRRFDTYLFLW